MDRSARHSSAASPVASYDTPPASCSATVASLDYPKGLPWDVADSVVRELLRIPTQVERAQWVSSRPVANLGYRAPLGESATTRFLLEIQREGHLPNLGQRD